ncbi:MAG: DUF362 domain-containing protein [Mariniphaga sp.]|nr:DUF362 domain-containing protein [Mariniphaga sp.]
MNRPSFSLADRINNARNYLIKKIPYKPVLLFAGFLATVWFLIRVIPKPSRAGYPCMRAAAPLMSGFVLYILSFTSAFTAFRKSKTLFQKKNYAGATLLIVFALISAGFFFVFHTQKIVQAKPFIIQEPPEGSNNPIGKGVGIFPGRVVWAWNPEATNAACDNTPGNAFWNYKNNDTVIIRGMVEESITELAGTTALKAAWDSLFTLHNRRNYRGNKGYDPNETIFIKINQGTASWLLTAQEKANGFALPESGTISPSWRATHYATTETGPFVVLNILRQLVDIAGVPQQNIYIGDPMAHIYDHNFRIWHSAFPDVNYADKTTDNHNRTYILPALNPVMHYSDKGEILEETEECLFEEMEEADYLINMACLKSHVRAGITLCTKNHFGSISRDGASHLHPALVSTSNNGLDQSNTGYKKYRVMVDIMGHKNLGANTMLFIVEGLFGGSESEVKPPRKWNMEPFNGHWTSSIFMSLDQVALESVCYDFLREEFNGINQPEAYPNWEGVDDHLHQAADPKNWPEGFEYNPDNKGVIKSLGVHEHWNNPKNKMYSQNLGTGQGIELKQISGKIVSAEKPVKNYSIALQTYPNPFDQYLTIAFELDEPTHILLKIYQMDGKQIKQVLNSSLPTGKQEIRLNFQEENIQPGMYIISLSGNSSKGSFRETQKVQSID